MVVMASLEKPFSNHTSSIFYVCMESNAIKKSTKNSVALRFFAQIASIIGWIARNGKDVDQFLQNPFWFFPRIFSTSGQILLRSRAL